ncbi:hypothetical protein HMPREF1508_0643 [Shuttleworthella sp. MSX8B]|uniref:hypothetical protein n=1 Tax=Shuttleworthella sp. MSX8B TaxID=936574 RepID=UPI0004466BF2|nr:hypothetical protein [Shuttleworthia sp. MSX8B]EUB17865.1 hypothetical protein HMPREF1508_0643 [Shuttleworthia sp. MSX8B]
MNKFLRIMFVFVIAAMSGAVVLQLLFPDDMASHSAYRVSYGWQREIAVWDIAVMIILIAVNLKYDAYFLKTVLLALIVGGIGIGTNHLVHFLDQRSLVNGVGAIENYLLVLGWIVGWKLQFRKSRK